MADILAALDPPETAVGFRFLQHDDAALNLADFGCFQTKFALGCP